MRNRLLAVAWFLAGPGWAQVGPEPWISPPLREDDSVWAEDVVQPPGFPRDVDLVEIQVSAAARNRFLVDPTTLGVGKDGVVRYVLVVKTPGGATNVTYEGIRCRTGEYRLYATGRQDGSWAKARLSDWRLIENKAANRQHATLNRDLFCPVGVAIRTAEEGRDALRRGRHPDAQ